MTTLDVGYSVVAFMFCSAAMTITNKQVLRTFELPLTILYIQMAFASFVLATCLQSTLRFGSWNDVARWMRAVTPLYALLLASGMLALRFSSMGAVVVARNVTPLMAIPIEALVLRERRAPANTWTWASLVFVLAGAILYMRADIGNETSFVGAFFIVVNMCAAVVERLVQRHLMVIDPVHMSTAAMLLLKNVGGMGFVGTAMLFAPTSPFGTPETQNWRVFNLVWRSTSLGDDPLDHVFDVSTLLLSCACGLAIGWTALRAQAKLSVTSMLVLTNLNKVVVVLFGIFAYGEARSALAIVGMAMALAGGLAYGALQLNRAKAETDRRVVGGRVALGSSFLCVVLVGVLAVLTKPAQPAKATDSSELREPLTGRPRVDIRRIGVLDIEPTLIQDAKGAEQLPFPTRFNSMFAAMLHDPATDEYHIVARVTGNALLALDKETTQYAHSKMLGLAGGRNGVALYYAKHSAESYRRHVALGDLPWYGPRSGAQNTSLLCLQTGDDALPMETTEDPRLLLFSGEPFVVFNGHPQANYHRRMWIAPLTRLQPTPGGCRAPPVVKLVAKGAEATWEEKNWSPFVHRDKLHFVYAWDPLVILRCPDWTTGLCERPEDAFLPVPEPYPNERHKVMHGGTQLLPLADGRYFSLIHTKYPCSQDGRLYNANLVVLRPPDDASGRWTTAYVGEALLDWRLGWPPVKDPVRLDRAPLSTQLPTSIVYVNASADEVAFALNEMDGHTLLVRARGLLARAKWGANWAARAAAIDADNGPLDWEQIVTHELREVCGKWPMEDWVRYSAMAGVATVVIAVVSMVIALMVAYLLSQSTNQGAKHKRGARAVVVDDDDEHTALAVAAG